MKRAIDKITLKGFKSIRSLEDFALGPVNILIGANGSGKSNFVSFFTLLHEMVEGRLAKAINKAGGADAHLYLGPKVTRKIEAHLKFGKNSYEFVLEPTADNRLIFDDERIQFSSDPPRTRARSVNRSIGSGPAPTTPQSWQRRSWARSVDRSIGHGHSESNLREQIKEGNQNKVISEYIHEAVSSWTVYHFHDTSDTAAMRRTGSLRDNERLRQDGANLAAFLYHLREENEASYSLIGDTVRLVAPFFKDFKLRPRQSNGSDDQNVDLEWEQKDSDYPFHPSQLSDGTLRFIALATALLQPEPPATILIDEPELGLHPYALDVLASLILQAQERTQLIVSTQSASLLNAFEPDQIVVIERENGESKFRRLEADKLKEWLAQEYTLGDLWQKNIYGGGPTCE